MPNLFLKIYYERKFPFFPPKQCVPELLTFCFPKFSVDLYCFNCLPCLLLFFFFCLYHKIKFFKFVVNRKIIPEILLLNYKQTELSQHFLMAHVITISTFCELYSVAPNAVSHHAQKLDTGHLWCSNSKRGMTADTLQTALFLCLGMVPAFLKAVLLTLMQLKVYPFQVFFSPYTIDLLVFLYLLSVLLKN